MGRSGDRQGSCAVSKRKHKLGNDLQSGRLAWSAVEGEIKGATIKAANEVCIHLRTVWDSLPRWHCVALCSCKDDVCKVASANQLLYYQPRKVSESSFCFDHIVKYILFDPLVSRAENKWLRFGK